VNQVRAELSRLLVDPDNLVGEFGPLVHQCQDHVTFDHTILPISVRSRELSMLDWQLVSQARGVFAP
jgi:hypothetical protein